MCFHKENIQLSFGANSFQYNLHLPSYSVHKSSSWLIHCFFHIFSSVSCFFFSTVNFFCWLCLFTFPFPTHPRLFLCGESFFEVSVIKGPITICLLPLYLQSQSSDSSPFYWHCLHILREWDVLSAFVTESQLQMCWVKLERNRILMHMHVPTHTCTSRPAAL